mmetsp:Transcript_2257/g.3161  ORF Transcript_2257/g.3161 Transcript_2257/m.3161 type:complete len:106 (-) Transcript_2257:326-643(-)|eukprot:CAMPEP_0184870394 /NCGR_PEP_ID=MMETSP0580-20130426/37284_1 /TAXON_ID=1118495 /ORGANISM="Dactyliosolen fragilissimus" /LENGTH=105 /DNA_ID=CAMNT_0027372435 /DNA_START=819 /DNA_END=1136 /DNA_ORIENTATION=-
MKTHLRTAQDDLNALQNAASLYCQQAPYPHQANIATITNMVAQRLMDNQAHHEQTFPDLYRPLQIDPPVTAPSPAPSIPDAVVDMANAVQLRDTALLVQMKQMMQ